MARLFDTGIFSVNATNGSVGVGYKLYFYTTGTSTPKNTYPTYADAIAGTNANANPVVSVLDGRWPPIWLTGGDYKAVLKDADDVTLETKDPADTNTDSQLSASGGAALIGFIQSGSGAAARTVQDKERDGRSVKDFGVTGLGVANETSNFQAAITAAAAVISTSSNVIVPAGIYLTNQVTIPANVKVILDEGAIIRPQSATTSLFKITGGRSAVIGGRFENTSSLATSAILIDKPFNNTECRIESGYYAEFTNAVKVDGGDCIHVRKNTGVDNDYFVFTTDEFLNCEVAHNYILGGVGVSLRKTAQGAEGVSIHHNIILPASGGTRCIELQCGLEIAIHHNILDQVISSESITLDGSVNTLAAIKIHHNWLGRQSAAAGADYGIYAVDNIRGLFIETNTFVGFTEANIHLDGNGAGKLQTVRICNNNHYFGDPAVRDINLTDAEDVLIDGEKFNGTASIAENSGVTGRVVNCDYTDSAIPTSISGGLRYGLQLAGMTLKATGTASASNGAPDTETHGLSYTPSLFHFNLTPAANCSVWVDTITSTQFNANCDAGGATNIGWTVDMTR